MKKIIIPTLLTLSISPLISMVGCNKEPQEEPASDTREWDYTNGYLCEARNYPVEGLEAQYHNTAIVSYLTATAEDPRGFVDDLFLAENYNYLEYYGYLGAGLKKYKVRFTVSDIIPDQHVASVHVEKEVQIQKGTGPEMNIAIDLAINKLPYESFYSIQKERITSAAMPVWSFYPTYKRFGYGDFADEMMKITTDWSIKGQILIETEGLTAEPLIYDWNKENIKEKLTEQHYADLIDSYSAVPTSYYFSYLHVLSDEKFAQTSNNVYKCIVSSSDEQGDKVFVFKANDFAEDFEAGNYTLTILDRDTPLEAEYVVMDRDDEYLVGWTNTQGQFPHPITLNANSYLIFKLGGVISEDRTLQFVLSKN